MQQQKQNIERRTESRDSAIIRFAGDSGDGIQVTGEQFTSESAFAGNDLATLPNFPAEIRAPAGTLAGVSAFQIHFGNFDILTPGDTPDVLVAMNPAALKANLKDLKAGGIIILNEDAFHQKNLAKVGYAQNPCEDETLKADYRVYVVPVTRLTKEALSETSLSAREVERCKNFFTLGVMLWMFNRGPESTLRWIQKKFAKNPDYVSANIIALKAGMTFAEATEIFEVSYQVPPARLKAGTYRNINGTIAMAYGLISAAKKSGLPLFFGAYPITPASDLLHELARHKKSSITTFQAEDEIAAICAAIGASYAGSLAVTSSSGPGIALKTEALGLAVMTELPLVVLDIQRGGPSTGLPTKTEQSDLFQAIYGRPGDTPVCVLAVSSPSNAFTMAYTACQIAVKYMTPVMLLSEGFIATCSEPWLIPDSAELSDIPVTFAAAANGKDRFLPYQRNEQTLARQWALPGTPGLMHRIGGLEKEDKTGNVSYDPDNHHRMTELRHEKIARIAQDIPALQIDGPDSGDLLVIGWGGTEGAIRQAVLECKQEDLAVSRIHLHYLNPLPSDLGQIIERFSRVLIPEINTGQLRTVLQSRFCKEMHGLNLLLGQPLQVADVRAAIKKLAIPH